jgi:hypothetical protein
VVQAEFTSRFEDTCEPTIIRNAMDAWPAMHLWTIDVCGLV